MSDVLKHTVYLFLLRHYEYPILYKSLRLYYDSSFNVWILLKSCVIWLTVFFILILTITDLCNAGVCTSCLVLVGQRFVNIQALQFGMCAVPGINAWLPRKLAYVV
jgi:hypothetical protein